MTERESYQRGDLERLNRQAERYDYEPTADERCECEIVPSPLEHDENRCLLCGRPLQ